MVAFRNSDTSGRPSGLLLRCVLYSLLALALMIVDKRYDQLGQIRRWLSIVAYPVEIAVASPFEGWHWFRESVTTRDALRADKARLEEELRIAQFKLQRYEALEAETQRLRGLRSATSGIADRFTIGDVMDVDLDAFRERVLVDKGAHDGIFVGQAVLDGGGVFGQVARVEQLTSEVILVSDPAHAIPVQVNRNGLRTIAVGTGDPTRLKLPYLPTSADIVAGDLLVTSGLGGGFPAGYPVGTVAEVKRDPAQSLAEVEVRPAAHLDRARELMFVWLKPGAVLPKAPGSLVGANAAGTASGPATRPATGPAAGASAGAGAGGHAASAAAPDRAPDRAPARAPARAPERAPTAASAPAAPSTAAAARTSGAANSVTPARATNGAAQRSNGPTTEPPAPKPVDPNDE